MKTVPSFPIKRYLIWLFAIILEDNNLIEDFIEEGNDLKELENNYIYKNELLKSENTRQEEIVKDLSVLLDNFKKQKVDSGLYEKIKLCPK